MEINESYMPVFPRPALAASSMPTNVGERIHEIMTSWRSVGPSAGEHTGVPAGTVQDKVPAGTVGGLRRCTVVCMFLLLHTYHCRSSNHHPRRSNNVLHTT